MITPVHRRWWTRESTVAVLGLLALVLLGGGVQGGADAIGILVGITAIVWGGKAAYGFITP